MKILAPHEEQDGWGYWRVYTKPVRYDTCPFDFILADCQNRAAEITADDRVHEARLERDDMFDNDALSEPGWER